MIVVTAPTGNIGGQVLANILDSGEPIRVIARDPSRLPPETRERVEVIEGSHGARDVVMEAFEGADQVFWLPPGDPASPSAEVAYVDFTRPAAEAMVVHGVKRAVGISALGRGWPMDAGHVTATLAADDLIGEAGVAFRALACASLMENILRQTAVIRDQGAFYWPAPAGLRLPMVATRDVAATASRLLLDPSWTGVDAIPMRGPQDLTFAEMFEIVSEVLGKPVAYRELSMDDLRSMVVSRGTSPGMAQAMVDMLTAKNEGMDDADGRVPAADSETPTTFRQWCGEVLDPAVSRAP